MSKNPLLPFLRASVLLIALLALLVGYYWVHKPIGLEMVARIGGALVDLATTAAILSISGGFGRAFLRRIHWEGMTRAERIAIEGLFALGVISLLVLAVGLIGILQPAVLSAITAILALILLVVKQARQHLTDWFADMRGLLASNRRYTSAGDVTLRRLVAVLLIAAALIAFAPPYAWDSMTYHLVIPLRYLTNQAITTQPDNFFFGFPQGMEMLYTLAIGLFGRLTAAAPLHFVIGVLGMLCMMGLVRRVVGVRAAWIAAAILLSSYSVWRLFGWAYVDLGVLAFCAAALSLVMRWREDPQAGFLLIAGVMLGYAVSVKYIAGGWAVALFVLVMLRSPRRALIANALRLSLPALIVFAPWMIKGALLYGNPIYPYFFGGLNWDAARTAAFNITNGGLISTGRTWHLPVLPFAATILGVEKGEGYAFTSGMWLLTAPFLLIITWGALKERVRRFAADGVIVLVVVWIIWGVLAATNGIAAQTRMIVMALPLCAALGAAAIAGLDDLPRKPIDVGFIVRAIFRVTLVLSAVDAITSTVHEKVAPYWFSLIDEREYMYTQTGAHHPALADLTEHVPAGAAVLLMWEPRSLYCPPSITCRPDVMFDHWRRSLQYGLPPDQVFEAFHAQGNDYLLVFSSGLELDAADPAHAEADAQFQPALEHHMIPVWTDGFYYTLYAWR